MATVTHGTQLATTSAGPQSTPSFTPAANDLLVVFAFATNSVDASPTLVDSAGLLTFTKVTSAIHNTSLSTGYLFVANQLATAVARTLAFNTPNDVNTGCIVFVARVSGMTQTGAAAARQTAKQDNQAAAGTPAPTFASAVLTGNPTLGFVFNTTNPAGMTPPTGWTEPTVDVGYATPASGGEYVARNSGFTGTTVTWGSTSTGAFGSIVVELDTSAGTPSATKVTTEQTTGRVQTTGAKVATAVTTEQASGQARTVGAKSATLATREQATGWLESATSKVGAAVTKVTTEQVTAEIRSVAAKVGASLTRAAATGQLRATGAKTTARVSLEGLTAQALSAARKLATQVSTEQASGQARTVGAKAGLAQSREQVSGSVQSIGTKVVAGSATGVTIATNAAGQLRAVARKVRALITREQVTPGAGSVAMSTDSQRDIWATAHLWLSSAELEPVDIAARLRLTEAVLSDHVDMASLSTSRVTKLEA